MIRKLLLALLCTITSMAHAEEDLAKHWVIARAEAQFPTAGIRAIELRNRYGNIRVRGTGESVLDIITITQHHEKDPVRPSLQSHTDGDKLIIEVVYPAEPVTAGNESIPGKDKRRVDVSGFVPNRLKLAIETTAGFAESKGHKGHLDVRTETGRINIKTKGSVSAVTDRGEIQAYHQTDDWPGDSSYHSKTGNIVIWLSETPNIVAGVDTEAHITTDYSLDIKHHPGSTRKTAIARIGKPNHELSVVSIMGNVTLSRKIRMLQSK